MPSSCEILSLSLSQHYNFLVTSLFTQDFGSWTPLFFSISGLPIILDDFDTLEAELTHGLA